MLSALLWNYDLQVFQGKGDSPYLLRLNTNESEKFRDSVIVQMFSAIIR